MSGGKGRAIKDKNFILNFFPTAKIRLPLISRGGGLGALMAMTYFFYFFFAASLINHGKIRGRVSTIIGYCSTYLLTSMILKISI